MAEEFTIPQEELQEFTRQMQISEGQFRQFEAANRAIARSVNPEIFDISRDIEESAILDLYQVIAAVNQIEAEEGDKEEAEDVQTVSTLDRIEKNRYNFVATYIFNGREFFSDSSTSAAEDILQTNSVWEKREAFTELMTSCVFVVSRVLRRSINTPTEQVVRYR